MKNKNQERLRHAVKNYHRSHQWRLRDGLMIPHCYSEHLRQLSWWDDVGFILSGRRVMVWWVHPRMKYATAIENLAWKEAGDPPSRGGDIFGDSEKQFKKVGRSRKKVASYLMRPTSAVMCNYYDKLKSIEARLEADGIDFVVHPSLSVETLDWCRGITLCAPIEVRDEAGIAALAALARRLIRGETSLSVAFPGYSYGREDWLAEAGLRECGRNVKGLV